MANRILIIEDEPLIARDLKRIVTKYGYEVAGICYNSDNALDVLSKKQYDLILLDIHLQGSRNGIELAHIINKKHKKSFIFITSFADRNTLELAKITMPAGYVVKPFNEQEVFSAIEIATYRNHQNGDKNDELTIKKINRIAQKPITEKEFDIIQGIIEGKTNIQLSTQNHVTLNTIKTHIKNIYNKLNVHSKPELITKLFRKD